MKALTIMEPWAWCIIDLSEQSDRWKCVENRHEKFPRYTGPLLIHSGSGDAWLEAEESIHDDVYRWTGHSPPVFEQIAGRGIIGGVHVVANCLLCEVPSEGQRTGVDYWQFAHKWASGPRCLLLARPFVFPVPIKIPGKQGPWEVHDDVIYGGLEFETWKKFKEWRGDR